MGVVERKTPPQEVLLEKFNAIVDYFTKQEAVGYEIKLSKALRMQTKAIKKYFEAVNNGKKTT